MLTEFPRSLRGRSHIPGPTRLRCTRLIWEEQQSEILDRRSTISFYLNLNVTFLLVISLSPSKTFVNLMTSPTLGRL